MIYLSALDYNLPHSFGSNAEFHPRFAERSGYGKFIIGRIVVIGIFTGVALMPIVVPMFVNPFMAVVESRVSVAVGRSMTVVMFFIQTFVVPVHFVLIMNRLTIGTASVMFGLDALFGRIIAMPIFPAVRQGSAREYKNQRDKHHTDFQKFCFHCLASFVRIYLFRRSAGQKGLHFFYRFFYSEMMRMLT
jgi:hypothetical protein